MKIRSYIVKTLGVCLMLLAGMGNASERPSLVLSAEDITALRQASRWFARAVTEGESAACR